MKPPAWFLRLPEAKSYWITQGITAAAAVVMVLGALTVDGYLLPRFDALLAGFMVGNMLALHSSRRWAKVANEQQNMLRVLHELKTNEIAEEIVRTGGRIVNIDGSDIPINPTKH